MICDQNQQSQQKLTRKGGHWLSCSSLKRYFLQGSILLENFSGGIVDNDDEKNPKHV